MVDYLVQHRLYSILFLPRRQGNRRSTPSPSALLWALLEEVRFYLELQYNENVRIGSRPLRESLFALIGKIFCSIDLLREYNCIASGSCEQRNPNFIFTHVDPLMPTVSHWQKERSTSVEIGALIEIQVIACEEGRQALGRSWWPLATAHISPVLQVFALAQNYIVLTILI